MPILYRARKCWIFNFMISSHSDELLDIVNEYDQVIGQKWRSEIDAEDEGPDSPLNIRSINAFIENDKGQLWIPRRTASKKRWPLALDMSISGCVSAGETYEQAFERETQEEVNLDTNKIDWKFIGHFSPYKDNVRSFMNVYKISMNEAPAYNPDDYCEFFWLSPQETMDRIKKGNELHKPGLPKLLRLLYNVE